MKASSVGEIRLERDYPEPLLSPSRLRHVPYASGGSSPGSSQCIIQYEVGIKHNFSQNFFSYPEQLMKSSCPSVGPSVHPPVRPFTFVKK